MNATILRGCSLGLLGLLLSATAVFAQATEAGIAGIVRDSSGGVLPGVTVAATSPVLIEQQRAAVTDGEGRYIITALRPGTYAVTFTLEGFTTVKSENVELRTGFTANVEAEMRVGSLAETITVSTAAPLVDVQNVRRQQVVTDELMNALPTSTKSISSLASLTTGLTGLGDIGGQYQVEPGNDVVSGGGSFHGKSGTKVSYDGMGMENSSGNSSYQLTASSIEEIVMSTSGISADTNADGAVVNVIPKEGSNTFRFMLGGAFSNRRMEANNLDDNLRARGLNSSTKTSKLFDEWGSVGGPLKRDRIWFFATARSWGFARQGAGVYWNRTQNDFLTPPNAEAKVVRWTPWVDRPLDRQSGRLEWYDSGLTRITYQASRKNKIGFTYDEQRGCNCGSVTSGQSQEYYLAQYRFDPNRLLQATWTSTITGKLLLEAGFAATISQWNMYYNQGVNNNIVSVIDVGRGISYGAPVVYLGHPNGRDRFTQRASLSYVTGSHNFKAGFQTDEANTTTYWQSNQNRYYIFFNDAPILLTQWATPYRTAARVKADMGIYAQDQWKVTNKMTLNIGLRWDYFNSYVPEQSAGFPQETDGYFQNPPVNPWLGQRRYDAVYDVPSWKDFNPRMGIAYDLKGDGRTALKFTAGRYVAKLGTDDIAANIASPITRSITSTSRGWTDTNGNYVPDCDLGNRAANGECGALANQFFGQNNPNAVQIDPAILSGYAKRDSNWDITAEIQRQLTRGIGITGGYYFNNGGYFRYAFGSPFSSKVRATDNRAVKPADYDPYCITAPSNPALPNGGGYQVCDLADIKPEKFGQVENYVTLSDNFGRFISRNDFVGFTIDARLPKSIRLNGGFDTGRSVLDRCFVVDSPQEKLYCKVVTPFKGQTQFKFNGVVPIKYDFAFAFTWQNLSGPDYNAEYSASNAEIAPSLGRNLSGGRTNLGQADTIRLVAPKTLFEDRISRLDLRLSKSFKIQRYRLQLNLDAYNALNSNAIRAVNSVYGSAWRTPLQILDPRLVQVGGQVSF
ncbi:MAG: TonB-dependent receptor [Acidimicrobiia bacterium]|nr:TonB-dependent receptor [Acidimicrobiia bacterium]